MSVEHTEIPNRPPHLIPAEIRRWGRIAYSLYMQRVVGFPVPNTPHFDEVSTPVFVERLKAANAYLEFGSGGSTFLAATFGKTFTTVESDRYFLHAVKQKIAAAGHSLNPLTQRLLSVDIGLTEAWGVPVCRKPTPARLARWRRYFTAPWRENSEFSPDLILIDGRFRVACALSTVLNLANRSGWTILFDDYAGRPHYHVVEEFLTLSQMAGRMAIFTPKANIDRSAVEQKLETFAGDWR